jgi:hypothetical protein
MIGVITTNKPELVEELKKVYPEWFVVAVPDDKVINFYLTPKQ